MPDAEFPEQVFNDIGYEAAYTGQKSYNGVAILSKKPLQNIVRDLPNFADEQRRYIAGDCLSDGGDTIRLINVYVPNGQSLDSEKFQYKRAWLAKLQRAVHADRQANNKLVLVGDFNIAPSERDVHDPEKWSNKIHCSDVERLILQKLMSEGVYDAYRQFNNSNDRYSWWDYRTDGYSRNEGLRIDLILASASMLERAQACDIDEAPRKLERPSDHAPVIAEFSL